MTKEFRYSYNVIGFQGEDVAKSIDRLARLGYDAVEVEGEPETHDPKRIKKLAEDAGLAVGSVYPNFTAERDLSHPDEDVRNAALAYCARSPGSPPSSEPRSSSSPRLRTLASNPSPIRMTSGGGR
jgi:hypothetical protein